MDGQKRILIVDDSRTSRMIIRKIIVQMRPSWEVLEASSGDEAMALIAGQCPDYISMDMNMPGIDGLQASAQIREKHPDIRIVLCTANIQAGVQSDAARLGVQFIGKPVTDASVAQMIAFFEE